MRRKLFRLSVALLALAAAFAAAPKDASAFQTCPQNVVIDGNACVTWGSPVNCANCWYMCSVVGLVGPVFECVD